MKERKMKQKSSLLVLKRTPGEIIEVQGGHIIRSTGRKDRHSKIFTAKGARDRRVRLSAHTAIQFYDVQDRLGYDRPSKAVDWLIKKAKPAIDELAKLPPWKPTIHSNETSCSSPQPGKKDLDMDSSENSIYDLQNSMNNVEPLSTTSQFQSYTPGFTSRTNGLTQDLNLSLESFGDPMLRPLSSSHQPPIVTGSGFGFDSEISRIHKFLEWNSMNFDGGEFVYNLCQNQSFQPREPLQSSYSPLIRSWIEQIATDHNMSIANESTSINFCIPTRIQGEEQHDDIGNIQSSNCSSLH